MDFEHSEELNYHFAHQLLDWFTIHRRFMPWREDPTPYHVWISEIMLQQTRVEAVMPYYEHFLELFPTVEALSNAQEERLLKAWEGLGYYSRVRNLQKAANTVMDLYDGVIPDDFNELKKLSGIGSYTAGAISSIAFQKREPVCDGNVLRVLSRVFGKDEDISEPSVKASMEERLRAFLRQYEDIRPGDFNQALMELGALVCIPNGAPKCDECPVRAYCSAYKHDLTSMLPVKNKKNKRKIERKTILIVLNDESVLLKKRPEKGLLAGLYGLPETEKLYTPIEVEGADTLREFCRKELDKMGLSDALITTVRKLQPEKHIFTHIEWHMDAFCICIENALQVSEPFVWAPVKAADSEYALPSAYKKWDKVF